MIKTLQYLKYYVKKKYLKMNYCKGDLGIIKCTQNIRFTRWRYASLLKELVKPIFAFSTFKNSIPAQDRVSYSSNYVGTSIQTRVNSITQRTLYMVKLILFNCDIIFTF